MTDEGEPTLHANRWGDISAPGRGGPEPSTDICSCFDGSEPRPGADVGFHSERQDTSAPGWQHLLELVDEAAADGREEFRPLAELSPAERRQVVTLPPSIAKLTAVKHLMLYGSNLVRIPPEIGAMTGLEQFTPYTSYRLHWFPYEITRCRKLISSTVSTRALFGNYKLRPPFPRLEPSRDSVTELDTAHLDPGRWGATAVHQCGVCERPITRNGLHQVWISIRVATDVLPLLVNACSSACVAALPDGAEDHIRTPHKGGHVDQPPSDWD
ncbi:leucine-rich repeat domain-containing protein [Streptomyces sp. S3(2020)]|uniref:leucine-rich repeat domain-containing protein n=1 Tax=Streptomyces sp. S3(2020) TaxID=2732044 RepID=UPI0019D0489E|nr:leucine-rich repeat domain-containing protein [Streptomyces sp. S3(2020)]